MATRLPPSTRPSKSNKRFSSYCPLSELHKLCRSGNSELLRSYLSDTVLTISVNQLLDNGCAPIHEAAIAGHDDVIRVLCAEMDDLDINIRTLEGPASTPLHLAAQRGHTEAVIALVDCGAILHSIDRCWRTPQDVALEYNHLNVVFVINMFEIASAVQSNNLSQLEKLLVKVAAYTNGLPDHLYDWSSSMLNSALLKAAQVGNRHIIDSLIKHGANNFQECIDSTHQNNHISAFVYLCKSIINEDVVAIDILLARNDELVEHLPRYQELIMYRVILGPLLQNGKISLVTPVQVALSAGKLGIAGQIIRHSSHNPSSGVIDWHDLELTFIDPLWLQGVSSLQYVGLSSNKLRAIPDLLLKYRNLRKLQIHHNKISILPGELLQLPSIQYIDVSFNNIVAIPEIIRQRVSISLETLNLSNNKLGDFPSYFSESHIKSLDISFNRLSHVPQCIPLMRRLHTLNLCNNMGIETVPCELGNLRNLQLLGLDNLPYIKNIPSKEKSTALEFLRARARGIQSLSHYDVIVVGTTEIYNSCLERIAQAVYQHSKRKSFSFLKFSSTNQFLHFQKTLALSCSVYVLVWDCQQHQSADDLLCQILHLVTYAPNSPIVIAASWIDAITPSLTQWVEEQLENCLWKEFVDRTSVVILTVDREALVGQRNTMQYLLEIVDQLGTTHSTKLTVPNSYFVLMDYIKQESIKLLEDKKPSLLSEWDIWELVRSSPHHDLAGHKELALVISFLSSVASLLLLQTNRSDQFNHYVLNRQWLLDGLSGLLRRHQNQTVATGLYPSEYLYDLLDCPTLQSALPYALYLFVSQLGIAIPVTSHEVLIPIMLPSNHNDDFLHQYKVKRVYTFRITPAALWPQLIAHLLINMKYLVSVLSLDSTGELLAYDGLQDNLPEDVSNWRYSKRGILVWICGSKLVYSIEAIEPFVSNGIHREGIEIRVANTPIGIKALTVLSATVNTLLANWYPELWLTTKVNSICPHCSSLIPIEDCCQSLCKGTNISCTKQDCVAIRAPVNLIPDIYQSTISDNIKFVSNDKLYVSFKEKSSCLSPAPSESVFRGEYDFKPVAVKHFSSSNLSFLDFWHDLTILQCINSQDPSPYLIEPLAATADPFTLVYPLATFCSLEEVVLESNINLLPLLRVRIVYQLSSALEVLHSMKIIHRNICLSNILVFSLSLDDQVNIKLGGFSNSCLELLQGVALDGQCTFPAPEMSKPNYEYDQRVDVFSFAFTSYEILTRKKLKCRRGVKFQTALIHLDRPRLQLLSSLVPYLTPLLEHCWDNEPTKRPFFVEIVKCFQDPLHILTREGACIDKLNEYNAATARYTRQPNGTYTCNIYICSSILCAKDTTVLSYVSVPGLTVENTISLPCQYIICMCCSTDYLWVSFQDKLMRIYSATTLEFIKEIRLDSHVLVMAVSPDSVYLGKEDGEILMYNLSQPSPLHSPTKTHVISYQQPIKSLQVIQDSVVCCTKRSFIRIHPQTLLVEQEFPILSETGVKCSVLAVDVANDDEYLWVGLRRNQQIVVFNAITGKGIYGINCSTILNMNKSEVWVQCMLVVLDTVWVGLNTGHVLSFHAYSIEPLLLTYLKVHKDNVRSMLLLQPSYWGPNSTYQFSDNIDESESDTEDDESVLTHSLKSASLPMPHIASVLCCGQGINKKIPSIAKDGTVLSTRIDDTAGLHIIRLDGPDSSCAKKIECQAHRASKPYMESYHINDPIYVNQSWESSEPSHRDMPSGTYESASDVPNDFIWVSMNDIPPTLPPHPITKGKKKVRPSSSDSDSSDEHVPMGSAPAVRHNTMPGPPPKPHQDLYRHSTIQPATQECVTQCRSIFPHDDKSSSLDSNPSKSASGLGPSKPRV